MHSGLTNIITNILLSIYECINKDSRAVPGGQANTDGALFYNVGAVCGVGLPCPPYVANRPITCVM